MNVLVLNAGSSSVKFQVIAMGSPANGHEQRLCRGEMESFGPDAAVTTQIGEESARKTKAAIPDVAAAVDHVLRWLTSGEAAIPGIKSAADLHAVGHRVVHGGERFHESVLITDDVLKGIEDCSDLAPLHNPHNLKGILCVREMFGSRMPQVAVFDTAFHASIPEHAYIYAVPYEWYPRHRVRRYGFHGTSHRYVSERYAALRNLSPDQTNVITMHLGNGCSAAAIRAGRSVDTSMGMTPLEGLVMGTRSGDLDPAILGVIAAKEGLPLSEVETILNTQSGLLGISGLTNDMRVLERELIDHASPRARLAIEIFCHRARKYIGAMLASMNGADAIIFTGGIGENSAEVRARICDGLEWAGLKLDPARNEGAVGREELISADDSRLGAYVIPTDEELLIARDTARLTE